VRTRLFRFVVTCDREGAPDVGQKVCSREVLVQVGQKTVLADERGEPLELSLDTECYAQETGSDAAATVIDHDTRDSAAGRCCRYPRRGSVAGDPPRRTPVCTDATCPVTVVQTTAIQAPTHLAATGAPALTPFLLYLLLIGVGLVVLRRRRVS
jgi:hypothetical protein